MRKNHAALIGSLALTASGLLCGTASAQPLCPSNESFFGTIDRVSGNTLTVQTPNGRTATVVIAKHARVNASGMSVRPGAFVGAYGCVTPGGVFHADEITLSTNQSGYNEHLTGIVRRVESNGRLLVQQNGHGYGTWLVPDTGDYHAGQAISATGMIGASGVFYPGTIDGHSTAYDTDDTKSNRGTITLSGTVRRVSSNQITVWEPAHGTTGTWILANAGRFRVGERVTATGTEDRSGRFYVRQISVM